MLRDISAVRARFSKRAIQQLTYHSLTGYQGLNPGRIPPLFGKSFTEPVTGRLPAGTRNAYN